MAPIIVLAFVMLSYPLVCIADSFADSRADSKNIVLDDSYGFSFEMDTVITPTRTKIAVVDSPVAVTILFPDTLSLLGIYQYDDAVRLIPGFMVTHQQAHSPSISYHGSQYETPRRMEVLFDQLPTYRPGYGRVHWNRMAVDLADLRAIEVARGPSVVDYGSKSFVSAVNLLSNEPAAKLGYGVSAVGLSDESAKVRFQHGIELANTQLYFRIQNVESDGFDKDSFGEDFDDSYRTKSAIMLSTTRLSERSELKSKLLYAESIYDWNIASDEPFDRYIDSDEKNASGSIGYSYSSGDESLSNKYDINLAAARYRRDQTFYRIYPTVMFLPEARIYDASPNLSAYEIGAAVLMNGRLPAIDFDFLSPADLDVTIALLNRVAVEGTNIFRFLSGYDTQNVDENSYAIEFQHVLSLSEKLYSTSTVAYKYLDVDSETYLNGNVYESITNFSNSTRLHFGEKFTFNIGAMYETLKSTGRDAFSPRIALNYKPTANQTIRLSYTVAKRQPDIYETSRDWTVTVYFDPGVTDLDGRSVAPLYPRSLSPDDLKPERVESIALGYYIKAKSWPVTADLKLFKDNYRDLISEIFRHDGFELSNDGKLYHKGIEGGLTYKGLGAEVGVNYLYLDAETTPVFIQGTNMGELEKALYARHVGAIYSIIQLPMNMQLGMAYYGNSQLREESYDRFDITLTKKLDFSNGQNLSLQYNVRRYSADIPSHRLAMDIVFAPRVKHLFSVQWRGF